MKQFFNSCNFFLLIIVLNALSCSSSTNKEAIRIVHQKDQEHKPAIAADDIDRFATLTKEDMQYIDLMIEDDAMVEIYYKASAGMPDYIEEIKAYLKAKRTGIKLIAVENFPENIKQEGKFYIHDTGDHRYVLYVLY
ncbi:MAG: hypothetical protein QM668_09830 [Agriterribacter sp.]|nr:MAG: hypothetical protein BGP13_12375 [Sphingobacteriales bacterium 40-81]